MKFDNLKVHFAGAEILPQLIGSKAAGVKYFLFSAFPFIADLVGIKPFYLKMNISKADTPNVIHRSGKHSIMDSGLFTLMFGAYKGRKDEVFIERWYDILTDFILESKYEGVCVEVDCQKVLGPEKAWDLRMRMHDKIPNRVINVFHKEDGQKGLDRMIEFSDYIAISVPELRAFGQKDDCERLAHYIKDKKPSIDIHLLGCTEVDLLRRCSFCSTSDSTSWTAVTRWGKIKTMTGAKDLKNLKNEKLGEYVEAVKQARLETGIAYDNIQRMAHLAFSAHQAYIIYEYYAGPQH